jgi:hypothetical protein
MLSIGPICFNPRTRVGWVLQGNNDPSGYVYVSIHAPAWGATYNGTIVADSILEGTWTSWTVDRGTYALMPGDVIKATVTPYANNAAVGPSYSATAVIQSTPQAQEPTAVQQVTPVSQPPVVQTPTTQPPTPVQTVPTAPPSTQTPNQQVSQPPADTTSGTSVPSTSTFDLFSWVKSHTLLSVGILAGTGLAIYGANKK